MTPEETHDFVYRIVGRTYASPGVFDIIRFDSPKERAEHYQTLAKAYDGK